MCLHDGHGHPKHAGHQVVCGCRCCQYWSAGLKVTKQWDSGLHPLLWHKRVRGTREGSRDSWTCLWLRPSDTRPPPPGLSRSSVCSSDTSPPLPTSSRSSVWSHRSASLGIRVPIKQVPNDKRWLKPAIRRCPVPALQSNDNVIFSVCGNVVWKISRRLAVVITTKEKFARHTIDLEIT